jgi:hypothetical protein
MTRPTGDDSRHKIGDTLQTKKFFTFFDFQFWNEKILAIQETETKLLSKNTFPIGNQKQTINQKLEDPDLSLNIFIHFISRLLY